MNLGISDKAFRVLSYRGHSHRLFKKEATKAYTAKGRKGLLMELQNCGEKDQTKNVNVPMEQEQSPLQQNLEEKGDFQRIFFIHLLFSEKPQRPPIETVHAALRKAFGQVDIVCSKGLWSFALKKYPVDFSDVKQVPAQILLTEEMPSGTEKLGFMERSQLWNIPDGEALLDRCPWKVMLSDFMSSLLSYQERSQMLLEWLQVAMDLFPSCLGVWVPSAGKLHTAQQVRDILAEKQDPFIRLAVNARFFRIQGTQDNVVDTLGRYALGLPDVQYHFHEMDPNHVVNHAYCLASYLFQNNSPIQSGETVDGIGPDGNIQRGIQWRCQYEHALIQPAREVLDICPGIYASGFREEG